MGEKAKSIGEKLENFGYNIYSRLGWHEILRDREIKCTKVTHKKKTHGIDLLHSFDDPYRQTATCVFTECKNRQWVNIIPSTISQWIQELEYTIECAQFSSEINAEGLCGSTNTGILLVHANDGSFNQEQFYNYFNSISLKSKRSPMNILVAGNDRMEKWNALLDKADEYRRVGTFNYVYPSIANSDYKKQQYLTVTHMFSRFVFGELLYERTVTMGGSTIKTPSRRAIVFSFDKISNESFRYLASMFKYYQFEQGDEWVFCFYPNNAEDIETVETKFKKSLWIKDKPMLDENKISIEFMNNRHVSPVEYGRGR